MSARPLGRGEPLPRPREVAEEVPIALRYNGLPHAVMMGTPADLEDFALGFTVTEGLARDTADVRGIEVSASGDAIAIDLRLAPTALRAFLARRRTRSLAGRTSCGLCGIEEVTDLRRDAQQVRTGTRLSVVAVRRALAALTELQHLHRRTGAAHAAAWARPDGTIVAAREDVGRHNALDKLIGHCLRAEVDLGAGFCLVTSRCSFEMVQKAVVVGMPTLVAISAPTALAIRTAEAAGLTLVALARADGQTVYAGPHRIAHTHLEEVA